MKINIRIARREEKMKVFTEKKWSGEDNIITRFLRNKRDTEGNWELQILSLYVFCGWAGVGGGRGWRQKGSNVSDKMNIKMTAMGRGKLKCLNERPFLSCLSDRK